MKNIFKSVFSFAFIVAIVIGSSFILTSATDKELLNYISPLYETLYYINNYFYEINKVDFNNVIESAVDGMVKGLGDEFSYYIPVENQTQQRIEMEGQYGGLGIEVTNDPNGIKIISPFYGTPAWKVGLQPNDLIIAIDDKPVSEMQYMEAINMMRGTPGTEVKLKIKRGDEILDVVIVREVIRIVPVKSSLINYNDKQYGYVLITKFNEPVPDELQKALKKIYNSDIQGLIIDLRNNPGGLLDVAIQVSNMFLDSGRIIVYVKDRKGTIVEKYVSKGTNLPSVPITVLVNNGSASASEIVAAALRDNGKAVLIGQNTFGKGSVQRGFPLSNGGTVYLTIAHYNTPNGQDIHKVGLKPDIEVVETTDTKTKVDAKVYTLTDIDVNINDPVISKALEYLSKSKNED